MQQPNSYCSHCGSTVEAGSKFCENCGAPIAPAQSPQPGYYPPPSGTVPPPPPASPYQPAAPAYPPAAQVPLPGYPPPPGGMPPRAPFPRPYQPPPKSSSPCLTILTIGCLVVICLAVVGVAAFFLLGERISTIFDSVISDLNPPTNLPQVDPAYFPTATAVPGGQVLIPQVSGLTGQQEVTDYLIFDDFSSNALGWEVSDSDISARDYEQDSYYIYVKKPGYVSWSMVPTNFTPFEIEFDANGPITTPGGSFGVMCQYQDDQNHLMVEIDLNSQDFAISMVVHDERLPLLDPEWTTFYGLYTAADATNHFAISCYPGWISLSVNGEVAGQVDLSDRQPFANPGNMALFVGTWENIGPDGYWMYFDNLSAWKPVQ